MIMTPTEAHRYTVSVMPLIAHGCIVSGVTITPSEAHGHTVSAMPLIAHGCIFSGTTPTTVYAIPLVETPFEGDPWRKCDFDTESEI